MDERVADWMGGYETDELVAMALCGDMVGLRFGGDHYRVRVAVPEGGLAAFDAFSFDEEFDGNLEHDMMLLPRAVIDTLDSSIENGAYACGDPLFDYRTLFGRLAYDEVAREQTALPLNVRMKGMAEREANRKDTELEHEVSGEYDGER